MADEFDSSNTILKIIGGLAGAGWIGNVITQYVKTRGEVNKKVFELQDKYEDCAKEKGDMLVEIEALKAERQRINEQLTIETADRRALEQKLASIEVAFNITFLHLKNHLGPDDPILAELKKHIDKGTGNLT
jgi:chromosome segregation ATPase